MESGLSIPVEGAFEISTETDDLKAVRAALVDEAIIDPKKYMGAAREAVKALCLEKIDFCGSRNKA